MKPIIVCGATGYTGRLVCETLSAAGEPFILAGRRQDALSELHSTLNAHGAPIVLDLADEVACDALCAKASVVINCVGPFFLWSKVLARSAATSGVGYVDITGEIDFVRWSKNELHALAQASGATLIHSCSFESLPSDLLAARLKPAHSLSSFYQFENASVSPGTRLTAKLSKNREMPILRDGTLCQPVESELIVAAPGHEQQGVLAPYPEVLFFHWTHPVDSAASYMVLSPMEARLWRSARDRVSQSDDEIMTRNANRRRPRSGPDAERRKDNRFTLTVIADSSDVIELKGADPYGLTALIAVGAALALREATDRPSGVLAPSQVFDPADFLDALCLAGELELSQFTAPPKG